MKVVELNKSNLGEACDIFTAAYLQQCRQVSALDIENAKKEKILPKLEWCLENHKGVAAYENGRMIGYLTGFYIEEFLSPHKGAYSPEWANCSVDGSSFRAYRRMYQMLGQIWMEDGCLTHAANTMSLAHGAQEAFFWNGFGCICIDAMRKIKPIGAVTPEGITIRPAAEEDIPQWLPLIDGHYFHLTAAPAFRPYPAEERETAGDLSRWLRDGGNHAWIAWSGDTAVGYMMLAPTEDGAAWMVGGSGKVAVNGAYVRPEFRGKRIAAALLEHIMAWSSEKGFVRCSVDFEATNLEASQFWLKYFQPVCRSVIRRLDERIRDSLR